MRVKFFAAMTGVALVGSALAAGSSEAATFEAACTGTVGDVASLKTAIDSANNAAGPDTIRLGRGCTYNFTIPDSDNGWYGLNALPPIASDITIEGNGATLLRDATAPQFRFFFVGADPTAASTLNYFSPGAGKLTLRNVTLRGGLVQGGGSSAGGGGAGMGGAIFSQGQVVIEASTLVGNSARGGAGGSSSFGNGGGGMAFASNSATGGGMGGTQDSPQSPPQGGTFGAVGGGAGGGAGFRVSDDGANPSGNTGGAGGGGANGMAGRAGGGTVAAGNGGGSGGNGNGAGTLGGGFGGDFGEGGSGPGSGGGGGVGGGGGSTGNPGATGGGGGFGGGGGWGIAGGGSGGFGGGAGATGGTGSAGAPGFGGGAAQSGPARGGGGAGFGGAVFNMHGTLTVRNSTFTQNSAIGGDSAGSPDPGKGLGGAVFNLNGAFTATGATFAANSATPNTVNAEGSSIYNLAYDGATARTAQATLQSTIVDSGTGDADLVSNKSTFITPANLSSANASLGRDDIVRASVTADGGTITGTALTANPLLGPLADNGGPTLTMAPGAASPAIDAGSASGLTTDQRGLPRPSNILEVPNVSDGADIGAVEIQGPGVFGTNTGVTLKLAKKKIQARGPVPVKVTNSNTFPITGKLSGKSAKKIAAKPGAKKKPVKLKAKKLAVGAATSKTVKLMLPSSLRRLLAADGKLTIRLSAKVTDEAGTTRTVTAKVKLKLKKSRNE